MNFTTYEMRWILRSSSTYIMYIICERLRTFLINITHPQFTLVAHVYTPYIAPVRTRTYATCSHWSTILL